jgi:hypothetical protein
MTLAPADSCTYMFNGTAWVGIIGGGGSNCSCNGVAKEQIAYFPCGGTAIPVIEVRALNNKVWMDRNLGASQVATSSTDALSYGDLYQWGRCSDGHEKRTSSTTSTSSNTDIPGHGDFILPVGSDDWRDPGSNSLWQRPGYINNPCPNGFHVPTSIEFEAERVTWSSNDAAGAFTSPLKLALTGYRAGGISGAGITGEYWTSTIDAASSWSMSITNTSTTMVSEDRFRGESVRCIKN